MTPAFLPPRPSPADLTAPQLLLASAVLVIPSMMVLLPAGGGGGSGGTGKGGREGKGLLRLPMQPFDPSARVRACGACRL